MTRLKELQGENPVTAFARYLEMPQNTLDCYIKGRRKPSVELVVRVCKKCGVSADWLLGLSNVRDPIRGAAPDAPLTKSRQKIISPTPLDIAAELVAIRREQKRQAAELAAIRELNPPSTICAG